MSDKKITVITQVCDICGEADTYDKCLRCGKDYCAEHAKTELIKYDFSTNFRGSEDGEFCKQCHQEILDNPSDKFSILLQSYRTIKNLQAKAETFYAELERTSSEAEECIKYHRKQLKV